MRLRIGQTLVSRTDQTVVIVVRASADEVDVTCGGLSMAAAPGEGAEKQPPADGANTGSQLGKRYVDASDAIELLCAKPGTGTLAIDGAPLTVKAAQQLPSSD
jgi:hypothetical protein